MTTGKSIGMAFWVGALALLWAGLSQASASAGRLADVEIYDRTTRQTLPVYWHQGRYYVAGQPGHEYEVRLRSRDGHRLLAVTSVDGVNVISGETASPQQSGYVLSPYANLSVSGWRKSMERTAAFYFTALPDSYAARTGRPHDVGVIGVALFREAPTRRWRDEVPEIAQQRGPSSPYSPPAKADSQAQGAQAQAMSPPAPQERLGTGHGRSERSTARHTQFQRASSQPDEIISIYYDSMHNLVAQGVMPAPSRWQSSRPRAFPAGFVPDP